MASPLVPGIERSTIAATCSSSASVAVRWGCASSGRRPARASARAVGRIAASPASSAVRAARDRRDEGRRPSARKSAPTIAAASTRRPRKARSNEAIGVTPATPGTAVSVSTTGSSGPIGRIELTISSPGMTSSSQANADARAACADQPSATTIASPMASEPSVSVVRLRSRASEPRASRSSRRRNRVTGTPSSRAIGRRTNGETRVASEQDRVDGNRALGCLPATTGGQTSIASAATATKMTRSTSGDRVAVRAGRTGCGGLRPARSGPRSGPARWRRGW